MRYSRLFIVVFVALGLAVAPSARVSALSDDTVSDALAEMGVLTETARGSAAAADLARRGGLVDSISRATGLERDDAAQVLVAVTDLVHGIAKAGERAGVLPPADDDELLRLVFELTASVDPLSQQASAKAAYLTERAIDTNERILAAEQRAMGALADGDQAPVAGPVEQWRPIVETYFTSDLVEDALSIIDCESNGDPDARNGRSGAAGLFQFIRGTWAHASAQAGFAGASPFEPEANIAAASWLVTYSLDTGTSPWAHWTCRP